MLNYFLIIGPFLLFSLLFQNQASFYENANYKNYLASMISDQDFNIVNRLDGNTAWMVSETGYYPAIHSEAQTPYLLIAYAIERLAFFNLEVKKNLDFHLGFTLLSLLSVALGFYFISKTLSFFKIENAKTVSFVFYFSSSLFFFSSFTISVFDTFGFLLCSYQVFSLVESETKDKPFTLLKSMTLGVSLALLTICKVVNFPLLFAFAICSYSAQKSKKSFFVLVSSILFVIGLELTNQIIKFEQVSSIGPAMSYLVGFDLNDLYHSIVQGYFGKAGYFTINLVFLLGLAGVALFLKENIKRENKYKMYAAIFMLALLGNLASSVGLYGALIEDHLPGRMIISILPLLVFGYGYLFRGLNSRTHLFFGLLLVLLYQYFLISYIYIDHQDTYLFPKNAWLDFNQFKQALNYLVYDRISLNYSMLSPDHIFGIVALSLVVSYFVNSILKKERLLNRLYEGFIVFGAFLFAVMTFLNFVNGPKKVEQLESAGYFANKSVALNAKAFVADYVIDAANSQYLNSDKSLHPLIEKGLQNYFKSLNENSFIIRNEETRQLLKEQSKSLSFWIKRHRPAKQDF